MKKSIVLCSILMFVALMFPFSVIEGAAAKQPIGQPESILNPEEAQLRAEAECWDKYNRGFDAAEAKYDKINNQPKARKELARGAFQRAAKSLLDALDRCLAKERTPEKKRDRIRRWAKWKHDEQERKAEEDYDNAKNEADRIRNQEEREQARRNAVRDRNGKIDAAEQEHREITKKAEDEYEEEHRAELAGLDCDQLATRKAESFARYKAAIEAARGDSYAEKVATDKFMEEDQLFGRLIARCLAQRPRSLPLDPDAQPDDDVVVSAPLKNIKQVAGSSNLAKLIRGYVNAQNTLNKKLEKNILAAMKLSNKKRILALESAIGLSNQQFNQSVYSYIQKLQGLRGVKAPAPRVIAQQPSTPTSKREKGACERTFPPFINAYKVYLNKETDGNLGIVQTKYSEMVAICPKSPDEQPAQNCPPVETSTSCKKAVDNYDSLISAHLGNYGDALDAADNKLSDALITAISAFDTAFAPARQNEHPSVRIAEENNVIDDLKGAIGRALEAVTGDRTAARQLLLDGRERALRGEPAPTNSGSSNED